MHILSRLKIIFTICKYLGLCVLVAAFHAENYYIGVSLLGIGFALTSAFAYQLGKLSLYEEL